MTLNPNATPTTLSDQRFEECLALVYSHLQKNPSIRKRDLRALTGITYDQGIFFFKKAMAAGKLLREGEKGGICYVLPKD